MTTTIINKSGRNTSVPTELLKAKGTLMDEHGFYYLICGRCGVLTSTTQAAYAVKELGHVECIPCQVLYLQTTEEGTRVITDIRNMKVKPDITTLKKIYYKTPERILDMNKIPLARRACDCGTVISEGQRNVSYSVTNKLDGTGGKAYCKKCLVSRYGCHIDHVVPEALVVEEIPPFEPEVITPVVEEPKPVKKAKKSTKKSK